MDKADPRETFLGDDLFALFDGYSIRLRNTAGNVVYLEPGTYVMLKDMAKQCWPAAVETYPLAAHKEMVGSDYRIKSVSFLGRLFGRSLPTAGG